MKPRSISATSVETYVGCPKRFAADMVARVYTTPEGPSAFGTALHAALDKYIEKLQEGADAVGLPFADVQHDPKLLADIWTAASAHYLGWESEFKDIGAELLERWIATRDLPHEVLSRESKERFELAVPGYEETQTVTFICDRVDRDADGMIEVIDYKSQWEDVTPDKMRGLVQPALYALAVYLKYPGTERVAVTYDMLRYRPVTIIFSEKQILEFQEYLSNVTKRIWEDDDPREYVNKGCRYCPRKQICKTLAKAAEHEMVETMELDDVAALRERARNAMKAFENILEDCDGVLLAELRKQDEPVFDTGGRIVNAKWKTNKTYSAELVLNVLGDEAIPFLKVIKTPLDKELRRKGGRFTPDERARIEEGLIETKGEPYVEVEPGKKDAA